MCTLIMTDTTPEWQLSSTDVLGKTCDCGNLLIDCLENLHPVEEISVSFFSQNRVLCHSNTYIFLTSCVPLLSDAHFYPLLGVNSMAVKHLERAEQEKRCAVT